MKEKVLVFVVLLVFFSYISVALTEITVQETELVDLEPTATDPDKDKLNYSFSQPLDENGKWQTNYGDAGEYNIKVTVSDGELTSSEEVLLIVEKKEAAPTIESFYPDEEETEIMEGSSVDFKVMAIDLNMDELSYRWELDGEKVSDTGTFNYFTDYESEGEYLLTVFVSDGNLTTTKSWRINITNFDRAPIFMPITNILIKETQKVTINLNVVDPDGDHLTFSSENMPLGAVLEGNVFTWLPGYDSVKKVGVVDDILDKYHLVMDSYAITFVVKGREKEAEQNVRITVLDANRPPVLEEIDDIIVNEEEEFTIRAIANDPDGDKLTFSYSGWTNQVSHKTNYGDAGEYNIKVTVSDGWLTDSQDVKIIVKKKNRAPVFKEIGSHAINEGELLRINLKATDADGDAIVFSSENLTNSSIHDNLFEWIPDYSIAGKDSKKASILFTASDGEANVTQEAVVTVNNVNVAPEIVEAIPEKEIIVERNKPVVFKVDAEDFDGDKLSYKWVFGLFEKYEGYGNAMKRVFTTAGNKKVKVFVSDGKEEGVYEWNVRVA